MRTAPKRIICGYLIHCWCNPLEELEYKTLLKEMCTRGGGQTVWFQNILPIPSASSVFLLLLFLPREFSQDVSSHQLLENHVCLSVPTLPAIMVMNSKPMKP